MKYKDAEQKRRNSLSEWNHIQIQLFSKIGIEKPEEVQIFGFFFYSYVNKFKKYPSSIDDFLIYIKDYQT